MKFTAARLLAQLCEQQPSFRLLSLLATTVGTAARGGPATLSEPDYKEVGRKELGDFFELRGGYSLGRNRKASAMPKGKASSHRRVSD